MWGHVPLFCTCEHRLMLPEGPWQLYCCSKRSLQRSRGTHLWQLMLHWKLRPWESHSSCSASQPRAALLVGSSCCPRGSPTAAPGRVMGGWEVPSTLPCLLVFLCKESNHSLPASLRLRKTSRIRAKSLWQSTACVTATSRCSAELRWHLPSARTKPAGSPRVLFS